MISFVARHATHTGHVRKRNEDNLLIADGLYAVADGLGGETAGDVASALAIQTLQHEFTEATSEQLLAAVRQANEEILNHTAAHPDHRGMATTLCAIALVTNIVEQRVAVVNVGDSRVYRFSDGVLQQLTSDHNYVSELLAAGVITPEEAQGHPDRSMLTRALGVVPESRLKVDDWVFDAVVGHRYLLCSDGLTREVDDEQIQEVLAESVEPGDAVETLMQRALTAGGHDNVTLVVVDAVPAGAEDSSAGPSTGEVVVEAGFSSGPPTKSKSRRRRFAWRLRR